MSTTPLQHTSLGELGGYNPFLATSLGELGGEVRSVFTYYELVQAVRDIVKDKGTGCQRYPDEMIVNALNRGMNELYRIRPDAFYTLYGVYDDLVPEVVQVNPTTGQVDWDTNFQLEGKFYPALTFYVVAQLAISEDPLIQTTAVEAMQVFRRFVLLT